MIGGSEGKSFNKQEFLKSPFTNKYWDARVFGNTFLQEKLSKEFIKTGVIQIGLGVSISPINIIRHTNTNKAGVEDNKQQGMAPLAFRVVEHGVYAMPFYVNPNYADNTGCTTDDIELFKLLVPYAYDLNRSAVRADVRIRHAWYIEHKNILGSCPEYLLIEALTPVRKGDANVPSQSWADYEDKTELPDELKSRIESITDLVIK